MTPGQVEGERRVWTGKGLIAKDVGKPGWWTLAHLPAAWAPMLRCPINGAGISGRRRCDRTRQQS